MSPRLAARVGQAVPACDALLMLGAVGASMPHASGGFSTWGAAGQSMMSPPEPRTPLSPRGNSRQQQSYPAAGPSEPPAICLAASMAANSSPSARRVGRSGASPSEGSASEPKRKPPSTGGKRGRVVHSAAFKLRLVREALLRPPENRIKPTCRRYPSVEPCQLRKWINGRANLEKVRPHSPPPPLQHPLAPPPPTPPSPPLAPPPSLASLPRLPPSQEPTGASYRSLPRLLPSQVPTGAGGLQACPRRASCIRAEGMAPAGWPAW